MNSRPWSAAAQKGDGRGGYILRDDASAIASWTFAFGGDVLTEDGTGYVYNSQATVDAMNFLKGMLDEGCASSSPKASPTPSSPLAMPSSPRAQLRTDLYQGDIDTVATEAGTEPDVWVSLPFPTPRPSRLRNIYGGDVMIVKTTPEQELAAWDFIKWYTSPEIQARWSAISGYFPTRASASDFLGDYLADRPQYASAVRAAAVLQV